MISVSSYFFQTYVLRVFQLATRTFNVHIPVGLHLIMMQTQVTSISIIQHLIGPAKNSESMVSLLPFRGHMFIAFQFSLKEFVGSFPASY